jgi:hypothetical protein
LVLSVRLVLPPALVSALSVAGPSAGVVLALSVAVVLAVGASVVVLSAI